MTEGSTAKLVRLFAEAAAELGRYQAAGDADRDEFAIELARLEAIYKLLEERHAASALEVLYLSEDFYVRLYAAKMSLLTDEPRARAVLDDLSNRQTPPNLSFNAKLFLTHWQKGWLFLGRR